MIDHTETRRHLHVPEEEHGGSGIALGVLGVICFFSWLSASADEAALTGGALAVAGLLMVWRPVRTRVSGFCWIAAGLWFSGSLAAFLPAGLMTPPGWRELLEAGGIETGLRITPQPLAALGSLAVMTAAGVVALWAAHQQPGRRSGLAMAFALAVALYALLAWQAPGALNFQSNTHGTFGFFPNRNHSATLLAMGGVVALGLLAQGIRRRQPWQTAGGAVILLFLLWVLFSLSISRAGVVLIGAGGICWLLLAGRDYRGGHAGKAVALAMGGGLLIFLLLETPVRLRMEQMAGNLGTDAPQSGVDPIGGRLEHLDGRVVIYRDTAAMIADAPWSGWGQGQFSVIFPQYQQASAALAGRQCLHPESDWLWMAAESGVPATLALAALALVVVLPLVGSIRQGRSRAVRAGLLVAALILPLHGLFDVPGHRFSLLWTSALLLAMAAGERPPPRFPRAAAAGWRVMGLLVAGCGVLLLNGVRTGRPVLAQDQAEQRFQEALELYRQEHRGGEAEQPAGADPLEAGIGLLAEASQLTPLESKVRGLEGMLALHYDDKDEQARRAFAAQRLLQPAWVELPLVQAEAWIKIDTVETGRLWKLAMERAAQRDLQDPAGPTRKRIFERIRLQAGQSPALIEQARDLAGENASLSDPPQKSAP